LQFTWDPRKAAKNLKEHGVSFAEAITVFGDPLARIHGDPEHSTGERREFIIGHSASQRLLLVFFTERGEAVRIISARRADAGERQDYEENV
jgi:uncharacterized DUF497 family protein